MSAEPRLRRVADGSLHELSARVTTIGRDESQHVCVPIAGVSRRHAEIERTGHGYVIRDVGSRNGTFVNGERIAGAGHPLRELDEIVLAGVAAFRFVDPNATPYVPPVGRARGLWVDPDTRKVWVDAQPVDPPLSERQQMLVELLARRPGELISRQEVVAWVWADVAEEGVSSSAVDALVKRLRARIRPLQLDGELIEVIRDRGLRLRSN